MKIKTFAGIVLSCLSFSILAKATNPLCSQIVGGGLNVGNGTLANPYLLCNSAQFAQIGTDATRLSQSYILGADIDFTGVNFVMMGSGTAPFKGNFNGNGYTLSSITVSKNVDMVAIFPHLSGATVSNLYLNKISIPGPVGTKIGTLAGLAENSTINNVHVTNLDMVAPDRSGGLIGDTENCVVSNSSTQGVMHITFGTDAGGGMLGVVVNSQISACASHVNLVQLNTTAFGVSAIGGLIGEISQGSLADSYADGTIDFSAVTDPITIKPHGIGGTIGIGGGTTIQNIYSAVRFINVIADGLGGAVGEYYGAPSGNIFWDTNVSGLTQSALGIGESTCIMKQKVFWISEGFNTTVWNLVDGSYPKLFSEG